VDRNIKIIIYGTAIAAVVSAICAITNNINTLQHDQNLAKLERAVLDLQAQCVAESEENKAKFPGSPRGAPLVCDPKDVLSDVGIQKKLGEAQRAVDTENQNRSLKWPYILSVIIVIISLLPWSWYFLLRRIQELSNAVRGR
jgi:hypothetical protein